MAQTVNRLCTILSSDEEEVTLTLAAQLTLAALTLGLLAF